MDNFNFYSPTFLAFGKDKEADIEKLAYTCCFGDGSGSGEVCGFTTLKQSDVEAIYKLMV